MYQITHQNARKTGILHPSVYSMIHQDLQLKCWKKRRAQELAMANCVHYSNSLLVLQGRVGAHKIDVLRNTIYVLLQISL